MIGAWRLGEVIVDPGPGSCLETLLAALRGEAPRVLALTHIHLDHAGAAGALARRFADLEVWVHERGAPHLIDPAKLIESARRLYGDQLGRLWGEVAPVPPERIRVLRGGEKLAGLRVAYAPGHASHHVCYLQEGSGLAFTGDVAGVRIGAGPVLAPTPPPDIDLQAWRSSLDVLEEWEPSGLAITHFGLYEDVGRHLGETRERLAQQEALARDGDERSFSEAIRAEVAPFADAGAYEQALPPQQSYVGLARWLSRSDSREPLRGGTRG